MIIDAHAHIFPDKIVEKAAAGIGKFYDIIMDCDGTVGSLLKICDKAGVDRCIVQSVATIPAQVQSINNFIAESVQQYPDRLIGFGSLHPDYEDIEGEVQRIVDMGLKGIKIHPDFQHFHVDGECAYPIYEAASRAGLPILVHAGDRRYDFSGPRRLYNAVKRFPELIFIGAHFAGWSEWDEAVELYESFPNLYVDLSSSLYDMSPERAAELIHVFGADRVMFGTDYPMWSAVDELERFAEVPITDEERELILYKNALRLLGEE
ncbi:MAG: amidohydrolase [Oscillospiraceae bacterium]|nr:amidohydrolase [Oscillospiraceae bacterium]